MELGIHPSLYYNKKHPNLISKSTIHLLSNVKFGIIRKLMLVKLGRQPISFLGKGHLKIYKFMRWCFYLTEPQKIFFQTTFHMKLSSMMAEIYLGLTKESGSYFLMNENEDPKLLNNVEYFQNELKFLIDANKEKYYSSISK